MMVRTIETSRLTLPQSPRMALTVHAGCASKSNGDDATHSCTEVSQGDVNLSGGHRSRAAASKDGRGGIHGGC